MLESSYIVTNPHSERLIDCILEDREPHMDVDWGMHITEMMAGVVISAGTGQRYDIPRRLRDCNIDKINTCR